MITPKDHRALLIASIEDLVREKIFLQQSIDEQSREIQRGRSWRSAYTLTLRRAWPTIASEQEADEIVRRLTLDRYTLSGASLFSPQPPEVEDRVARIVAALQSTSPNDDPA